MKKYLCLIFVLSLVLGAFCSCSGDAGGVNSAESVAEESVIASSEDSSEDVLPDLGGREFRVVQRWFGYNTNPTYFGGEVIWTEDESGAMSEVSLAKKRALERVQKDYNCTVTGEIRTDTAGEIRAFIENDILSGAPTVDFCFETYYYYFPFAENGYLANLADLGVNLSADWWDSGAVRDLSISGKHFYGLGDINTYDNDGTFVMLFNKRLYEEKLGDVSELYKLAADGGWTFDVLREKVEGFGKDETYGLLTHKDNLYVHLLAAGERVVGKDADDRAVFTLDNDRALQVYNDAVELYINTDDVLLYENLLIGIEHRPDNTLDAFKEGRGLFYLSTPLQRHKLKDMEDEYGILPMPKYNSEQEEYYHGVANHCLSAVFVPKTKLSEGDSGKEIGILLDALGKYSKEEVTPVYLKEAAPDEESQRMLELVLSARTYDLGSVYSAAWGSPEHMCINLDDKLAERIAAQKDTVTAYIEETMSKINRQK